MTKISVQTHLTGYDELADELHDLLIRAVRPVEQVTGLPVPDTVEIALVSADDLGTAYGAFMRRRVGRDIAGLTLTESQQARIPRVGLAASHTARVFCGHDEPCLIDNGVGHLRTLLVPDSLLLRGVNTADLRCDQMVRVLTRHAQAAASGGEIVPAGGWPYPTRYGKDFIAQLSDAHADWTSRKATDLVLDRPAIREPSRKPSTSLLRRAVLGVDPLLERRTRARARAFVERAVDAVGPTAFNRVWADRNLIPTRAEMRRPALWAKRLSA
ncbi:zinc-dependent metalloprotease [Streptomyces sp. NPDC047070]|uniref:zinc-dependent metalloprotease n=1 Tax=Streptomyces sp. NPDC047070 TaxID=3154923 RepID=UPI00345230B1